MFYPHESLWSMLHKVVLYSNLTGRQTRELVGNLGRQQTQPMLFPPQSALDRLSLELQLPEELLSNCRTSAYLPNPLVREFGSSGLISKNLRFCRSCMEQGFHSPIQQLLFVDRCPFHDEPLIDECPSCGQPIDLAVRDQLVKNPYGCGCGYTFWRPEGTQVIDDQLRREAGIFLTEWITWCQEVSDRFCLFLFDSEFGFMPAAHDVLSDIHASMAAISWLHQAPGLGESESVPPSAQGEMPSDMTPAGADLHKQLSRRASSAFEAWRVEATANHSECLTEVFDYPGTRSLWRDPDRCAVATAFAYLSGCWNGEENASMYLSHHWEPLVLSPVTNALRKSGVGEREIERWIACVSPALVDQVIAGTIDQVLSGHFDRSPKMKWARPVRDDNPQARQWRFSPLVIDLESKKFHLWGATSAEGLKRRLKSSCSMTIGDEL